MRSSIPCFRPAWLVSAALLIVAIPAGADTDAVPTHTEAVAGLELRTLGPALMGGRIADIAVDPRDANTWYLAVGSGGVWKTENAGVTWTPIFDEQPSYSTGVVALDPTNPDTVWVGTGENVSGRHVGWGDGVYKSLDGGRSWRRMGLADSEHIGEILVDPRDGDVVYVAAEGPLWSAGGDRGLFKTTDGGETWEPSLVIDEHTGVTSLDFDPRDPDVLYAATYQRRRHIWSLLAGGPESAIYKSTDAGASWRRIERGLPEGDMGKIGLAVSPADPDVVYATIEADEDERGFYRSLDRGESWERRNDYISNGTGPHYYQEIVASPHDRDRVYQMDVFLHTTADGGATMEVLGDKRQKHSDNHALWIDPQDPGHLLAGTDASLYETFDHGATWRQFPNLPISQFYKLALDDAEPFYNILGGAQDLGTLHGPARTGHTEGVRNSDWYVPLGADGYACAFDPSDPDLFYIQTQVGRLRRYDRKAGESIGIQPLPAPGESPERWNWDSPVMLSPHDGKRLYFASQRLWRSDDRGDSWTAVSGDLTRGRNRYELEVLDRVWSVDALYGNTAMSYYGTVTTLSESPLVEGRLYAGTDDGLIQVSEDGGASWRTAGPLPGVPELSFVNDVRASLHDPDTVFVAVDAHKTGDFRPHLFLSDDRGRTWRSISADLPGETIVWAIVQDHVEPDLLFIGTEFGLYFSPDRGRRWIELGGGVPTIAFRDLEIQRRESDLVGATFGRGFYVLDDYSPLRSIARGALEADAVLFPVRDAWWFVPYQTNQARGKPSMGSDDWTAANPPHGAIISYYLRDTHETAEAERRAGEAALRQSGDDVPFPGWEQLRQESLETTPKIVLTVRDGDGEPVRRLEGPAEAGIHRLAWDMRLPPPDPVDLETPALRAPWEDDPIGPLAAPGRYTVEMALLKNGQLVPLGESQGFELVPVPGGALPESGFGAVAAFQRETADLLRRAHGAAEEIERAQSRLRHTRQALLHTPSAEASLFARQEELEAAFADLRLRLRGDPVRRRLQEPSAPSILGRIAGVAADHWGTRQAATETHRTSLSVGRTELAELLAELQQLLEIDLPEFERRLEAAGAPWTPGRSLPPP